MPLSPPQPTPTNSPWWESLYDEHLATILLERRDPESHRAELDFIEAQLQLSSGARVFDQCCGIGSLALPMAQRGYEVHAIDLIEGYMQSVMSVSAIDTMASSLLTQRGKFRRRFFNTVNPDDALTNELMVSAPARGGPES